MKRDFLSEMKFILQSKQCKEFYKLFKLKLRIFNIFDIPGNVRLWLSIGEWCTSVEVIVQTAVGK